MKDLLNEGFADLKSMLGQKVKLMRRSRCLGEFDGVIAPARFELSVEVGSVVYKLAGSVMIPCAELTGNKPQVGDKIINGSDEFIVTAVSGHEIDPAWYCELGK